MQQFPIESSAFGEPRTYRITKIPMHLDDKDVSHVITIGEDITDWRRAEAALRAGGEARGDRHARRRRDARDQQSAGDDRRVRRELSSWRWTRARDRRAATAAEHRRIRSSLIQQEVHRCKGIIDGLLDFSRPKSTTKTVVDLNVGRSRRRCASSSTIRASGAWSSSVEADSTIRAGARQRGADGPGLHGASPQRARRDGGQGRHHAAHARRRPATRRRSPR